ncbi:hypothetical protein [Nonomuraea sp. NPDC049709]|uniref:hypothetical protein n=1 Tax=Nonomuraea sp. NPDC049709 TaxID=3154736 RepID=UPI0034183E14
MRSREARTLLLVALVMTLVGAGGPARAGTGGVAVTLLDPVPAAFTPHVSHTLGLWVLENDVHPPVQAGSGRYGLSFTAPSGATTSFTAVRMKEQGHYAVAVSLAPGSYRVHALQGILAPFAIGTLAVPGALKPDPLPRHLRDRDGLVVTDHWRQVRPPGFPSIGGGKVRIDADAMRIR